MNAKNELLELSKNKIVKCAKITMGADYYPDDEKETYTLKVGYNDADWVRFLQSLDFNYDNGFGGQNLYGIIWYKDDTWAERHEYDGSEWWEYKSLPEIPKQLQ